VARVLMPRGKMVDDVVERRSVLEERRDVLEEDALGREVLDVADLRAKLGHFHDASHVRRPSARQARIPTRDREWEDTRLAPSGEGRAQRGGGGPAPNSLGARSKRRLIPTRSFAAESPSDHRSTERPSASASWPPATSRRSRAAT